MIFLKKHKKRSQKNKINQEMEKQIKQKKYSRNKELLMVTYLFVGIFIVLMGYFVYFNWIKGPDVINSPYNTRQDTFADRIVRGSILSKDKEVLAETKVSKDGSETLSLIHI